MDVAPYRLWLVMIFGAVVTVMIVVTGIRDGEPFGSIVSHVWPAVVLAVVSGGQLLWIKRHPR